MADAGYLLAPADVARVKRMLTWFERRIEPAKPMTRRDLSDDLTLTFYELSEAATLKDGLDRGKAYRLNLDGTRNGDEEIEISHLMRNSNQFKGARGFALPALGRLVSITPGEGFAVALADGGPGAFFQARVEEECFGALSSPQPQIAIYDKLQFNTKSGQRIYFKRFGGVYYHVNSACPPTDGG